MKKPVGIGVVGCGDISGIYLESLRRFEALEGVACCDLVRERAASQAREHGLEVAADLDALLADPRVEIVLNLTPPDAHAAIGRAALEAGKHLYGEKPLATEREAAARLLELARERGLRVGCAPDTFMGAGLQTFIGLVRDGAIGEPVAATAFMACHGHEHWHPDPGFHYRPGGGPLLDMGPYYLTALVAALGPIRRVSGSAMMAAAERSVARGPFAGRRLPVSTPTHAAATLDFAGGAVATLICSFDVWAHGLPHLEIHGSQGSLAAPDPNTFGGPVRLFEPEREAWRDVPLAFPYEENSRGLGLADMACALRSGRPQRASGELAFHVLDAMCAIHESSESGRHVELASAVEPPASMRDDLPDGVLEG